MYTRPDKTSHLETIYYEVDMLEYCYGQLAKNSWSDQGEKNLYIEGFLLHYRNFIEFLSGSHHRKNCDLSTAEPALWAGSSFNQDDIERLQQEGKRLDQKYWRDTSQYLQHCTVRRFTENKSWNEEGVRSGSDLVQI